MHVLLIKFYINIEESKSLKDKRRIVKSLIESTREKFKISIAEVGLLDDLTNSIIGLVAVSNSYEFLSKLSQNIENFVNSYYPGRLIKIDKWIENVD
ncbi:MAG: DUF503 domain-containing protein [Spirochaetes bacterium]|nr:DUF503 domain-containing protein [Spirochaetota bacterium]